MIQTFGFRTEEGNLAWVKIEGDEVACFIPQYGSWYETKQVFDQEVDALSKAAACLDINGVSIVGRGEQLLLEPGQYHPRIWRGAFRQSFLADGYDKLSPFEVYGQLFMRSIVAAESLFSEVRDLFKIIEPQSENFDCFGHRFRELLMLLCTEVEACWSGVLKANDMELNANERFITKNYIKTCTPLRLTEWRVKLKDYGDFDFQPFRYWNVMSPSSSLPWYEAYNKVKHDREGSFSLGTLGHVLQAAAALHIMQVAQFGPGVFDPWLGNRFSIFEIVDGPVTDLAEVYLSDPIDKGSFHSPIKIG